MDLKFEELLALLRKQDTVIFNQVFIFCLGDKKEIMEAINLIYDSNNSNKPDRYFYKNLYFEIPEIIWNKVSTYQDLTKLNNYISEREATEELIKFYYYNSEDKTPTDDERRILNEYLNYIHEILEKCREFQKDLKNDKSLYLFPLYRGVHSKNEISPHLQNQILGYIINLEYTSPNKEYINI